MKRNWNILECIEEAKKVIGSADDLMMLEKQYSLTPADKIISENAHRLYTGRGKNLFVRTCERNGMPNEVYDAAGYFLISLDSSKHHLDPKRYYEEKNIKYLMKKYPPEPFKD